MMCRNLFAQIIMLHTLTSYQCLMNHNHCNNNMKGTFLFNFILSHFLRCRIILLCEEHIIEEKKIEYKYHDSVIILRYNVPTYMTILLSESARSVRATVNRTAGRSGRRILLYFRIGYTVSLCTVYIK